MADASKIIMTEGDAPATPAAGTIVMYAKSDDIFYYKNDAGVERGLTEGMANPMTTAGDMVYGGVDGAATRLAKGTAGQVLTMNSGATAPEWAEWGSGVLVQVKHASIATLVSGNTQTPNDNTIPQKTEGFEVLTLAITPTSATNRLFIIASVPVTSNSMAAWVIHLHQDDTAGALAALAKGGSDFGTVLTHEMAAGTTSETTFKVRVGPGSATTLYINAIAGSTTVGLGGVSSTTLTILEYTP